MYFELVDEEKEFKSIEMMAGIIWPVFYKSILPKDEIIYILKEYLSVEGIKKQSNSGTTFVIIYEEDIKAGFMSYKFFDDYIYINNLYILPQYRDKNVGQEALVYLSQFKLPLEIHINSLNLDTIEAFKHLGFVQKGLINDDIGNGYINKDVILRKEWKN